MKKYIIFLLISTLLLSACGNTAPETEATEILLSDEQITVDGNSITSDPSQGVYMANDIVFYPAGQDFTYGEGTAKDAHEQSEADAHKVIHITKPGSYVLKGKLSMGQIAIDLGKDAEDDPNAVVTLILDGVDISCTLAPAIIFYNVYECCSSDEDSAVMDVDTSAAGANIVINDGTENNISGSYVAKIYKSFELSEDGKEIVSSKKLHKYDGAVYSRKTMNIYGGSKGNGVLNINAVNEGLDTELHLTINGGIINIFSGNDGINTNEDNVSVTTVNGGTVNIRCLGTTGEGDGIDSNGWLVINGGTVIAEACASSPDAGIDSDKGIYINGGTVIATGNMLDHIAGGGQTYAVFSFASTQKGGSTYTLKNSGGKAVWEHTPANAFSYLIIAGDELSPGDYTFWQGETQLAASAMEDFIGDMPGGGRPEMPNMERPEMPEGGQFMPDNMPPQMPDMNAPEMPQGGFGEMPEGDFSQMPEGMTPPDGFGEMPEGMMPQGGFGGMFGGNMMPAGEASTTFTIVKGGHQFGNVSPAK